MINHSTVKERRGEFDRPKPTRTAKKSSIRRPVGGWEERTSTIRETAVTSM